MSARQKKLQSTTMRWGKNTGVMAWLMFWRETVGISLSPSLLVASTHVFSCSITTSSILTTIIYWTILLALICGNNYTNLYSTISLAHNWDTMVINHQTSFKLEECAYVVKWTMEKWKVEEVCQFLSENDFEEEVSL